MTATVAPRPAFPTRRTLESRPDRRRSAARGVLGAIVGALLASGALASEPVRQDGADETQRPPNFLFVLADDQGWTGTSVPMDGADPRSQSDYYRTPHLERLAREGTRFSRGYSSAPNCSPSRMAILTGKTPARLLFTDIVGRGHRTDLKGRQRLRPGGKGIPGIRPEEITLPELLKSLPDADYRTAHFGKWHLGSKQSPGRHGFDVSDGPTGNREGSLGPRVSDDPKRAFSITERANAFITESVNERRPFYCQVSHYAVHQAIQHRAASLAEAEAREPGAVHHDPAYAAMTADLDDALGRLLTRLDELGVAENTYVVYQADNGSPHHLSVSPPLRRFKPEIWEGGVRVPTFVRGPGVPAGAQCDLPTSGADWLPTLWQWAGGDAAALPADLDGGSLAPALRALGEPSNEPPPIDRGGEMVTHSPHYVLTPDRWKNQRPSSAIYDGRWKLVAWYETGEILLFDLAADPSEATDVGDARPEVRRDLWVRLRDYLAAVDAKLPTLDPAHPDNPGGEGDADADGLPDEWEFATLLTARFTAADDPDGDGVTNADEQAADSDPLTAP